jgi:hypothetical protein
MGLIAIGILVLAAVFATVLIRRRSSSPKPAPPPKRPRFGAVELVAGSSSCGAAKQLAGERLLAADAPMLPLPECTTRCRCSYRRYGDRRDINRRRGDDGLPEDFIYAGSEGRSRHERRS